MSFTGLVVTLLLDLGMDAGLGAEGRFGLYAAGRYSPIQPDGFGRTFIFHGR
jgi:hypothetical protein